MNNELCKADFVCPKCGAISDVWLEKTNQDKCGAYMLCEHYRRLLNGITTNEMNDQINNLKQQGETKVRDDSDKRYMVKIKGDAGTLHQWVGEKDDEISSTHNRSRAKLFTEKQAHSLKETLEKHREFGEVTVVEVTQ